MIEKEKAGWERQEKRHSEKERELEKERMTVVRRCYLILSFQQSIPFSVASDRRVHYLYTQPFGSQSSPPPPAKSLFF